MSELKLRPYQAEGIQEIRKLFAKGIKRVLFHLATGGGKTLCFCTMIKGAAKKDTKTLVVVRGIKLVHQASDRLTREGVAHGVIQGKHTYNMHLPTIVASIDTLYARKWLPEADFIVIDEAHLSFGAGYEWFLNAYKDKFILGVSATPHDRKRGMRHVADAVVYPISAEELIKQGYLCKMRYFEPSRIDRSKLEISSHGDYTEKSMTELMSEPRIMGDIVRNWIENGQNRPTFLFCSSIKHSKEMCRRFSEAGVIIEHLDAKTKDTERNAIIERLVAGKTQIVSSVGVLTTGVDVPTLSCLVLARPTMSYNMHIQILGRGTRPAKPDCIVFDHVGNIREHGCIEDEKPCNLDAIPRSAGKESPPRMVTCESCFAVFPWAGNGKVCPACKHVNDNPLTKKEEDLDYVMQEMARNDMWKTDVKRLIDTARQKGYKRGWVYFKIKDKHGEQVADAAWPMIRAAKGLVKSQGTPRTNSLSPKSLESTGQHPTYAYSK